MIDQSPIFMMIITLGGLILLPVLALLLALLFHRRTRPAGVILLGAGAVGLCLLAGYFALRVSHVPQHSPMLSERFVETPGGVQYLDAGWPAEAQVTSSHRSYRSDWSIGFLGGPFLLVGILVVLALLKYRAAAIPVIGVLMLGILGAYFVSSRQSEVILGDGPEVPLAPRPPRAHVTQAGNIEFAKVHGELMHDTIPLEQEASPSAPPLEADALPSWPDESEVVALPPLGSAPLVQASQQATPAAPQETPLEAMAAKEGVTPQQIAAALDPSSAKQLPDWLYKPSERVGNVVRRVVSEGPHTTTDVAYERVQSKVNEAVHEYLREVVTEDTRRDVAVPPLGKLGITPRWIRDNVVTDEFYLSSESSVASNMQTVFVRLEFNPRTTDSLVEAWQQWARRDRVNRVAATSTGVLGLMGLAWGLIKVDTATKGYYTKWLFIGVPLAIIGGVTLLGLFVVA